MDTNLFNLLLQAQAKDSTTPWITIASAVIAMIPAILAYLKGLKVEKSVADVKTDVKEVHTSVNGKLDQWLAVSKQQGKVEERQEAAAAQPAPSQPLTEERIRQLFAELMKKP